MTPCRWCGKPAIDSHTIPNTVRVTASRIFNKDFQLRSVENPNLVVQDTTKLPLLCHACDNSFSPSEGHFRQHFYAPLLSGQEEFEYDEWLLTFATSIAWKRLTTGIRKIQDQDELGIANAEAALAHWEQFLRGQTNDAGAYQHHIFLTQKVDRHSVSETVWHLLKEVFESTLIPGAKGIWVWTTIPGCILISFTYPFSEDPWGSAQDTRILRKGKIGPNQRIPEDVVLGWASASESIAREATSRLSAKQIAKIRAAKQPFRP